MLWLQLGLIAGVISFGILWLIGRLTPVTHGPSAIPSSPEGEAVFLFDGDAVSDHHAGALPEGNPEALTWPQIRDWLSPRFDGLPNSLTNLSPIDTIKLRPREALDTARLTLARNAHGTRVVLCDPPHACPAERHEMLVAKARMEDISDAFARAPHPIWKTGLDGKIIWRNDASKAAFDPAEYCDKLLDDNAEKTGITRLSFTPEGASRARWYEVSRAKHQWGALHHATDITKVVNAERMQKDFVQTLTKTFAYLTIGLAVFDRNRKLALFNPALVDLTSLGVDFLSGQPDLMAFFDKLRDRRVMPEPRSYASWRTQIGEVIGAAEGGLYQETWSLPNDVTYRVTGRPHPDGAVAFLFEDISAEVMLNRRFRSQLDLRQAALDSLPEAVIVIGPNGVLAFCNSSAIDLLGVDPDTCFADMCISDLMHACAQAMPAPSVWTEVEEQLRMRQQKSALRKAAEIAPGHSLTYRVELLPGGARMLILRSRAESAAKPPARLAAG
ncbi:PAS domain-containing protein [Roseovarius sp. S4756]|uniref:PAS domain-containing protein n=1 Tax=Roseovarius maritimus TaxID=3342637 RepID=UPI00372782A5